MCNAMDSWYSDGAEQATCAVMKKSDKAEAGSSELESFGASNKRGIARLRVLRSYQNVLTTQTIQKEGNSNVIPILLNTA
jgi:hypothetical protein